MSWWSSIFGGAAKETAAPPEEVEITGPPIRFQWQGKNYTADYKVFVEGRYTILPDKKTVLRIRAWRLTDIPIPMEIVVIEDKRARKTAIPAIEEPQG
jgi:hypothetical protein